MNNIIYNAACNLKKYRGLLKQLVSRDIKLKYRRSVLGYLWSVLNPLLTMIIITSVFSHFFKYKISNYPVYYLCGNVIFSYFNISTHQACLAVLSNSSLIKKVYLPKYIFVFSKITSCFIDFVFSLVALILVMLITHSQFSVYNLLFFIPAVELYFFCLGLGLFLAQANVFFRDTQYLYGIFCTALMYLTPLFYPIDILPNRVRFIVEHFNPLFLYVDMFRQCVHANQLINPYDILYGALWSFGFLLVGSVFFKSKENKFILYV